MKLSELIRKKEVATVTVATHATVIPIYPRSVATVASVNVANEETGIDELKATYDPWRLLDLIEPMDTQATQSTPFAGFVGTRTSNIEKNTVAVEVNTPPETDCLHTLTKDYAELKTLIAELCRIACYSDEDQSHMLAACSNLYPYQYTEQRDYFRLQVESAAAGRYWTGQTTH